MATHRSGYVTIDISDVVDEIEDDVLLNEVAARKLVVSPAGEAYDQDLVREAYLELRVGRVAEALSILDRLINPKWTTVKAAQSNYDRIKGLI